MKTIEHTIDIPASPTAVWQLLTDTDSYGDWNPFITQLDGHLTPGERLTVTIRPGRRSMTFRPTVDLVQHERHLRWRGRLGLPGIFDGSHELILTPGPHGGTHFTQRETFTGILVSLLGAVLRDTEGGFAAMNHALLDRTATQAAGTEATS
jgi:hypothetical protein